MLLHVGIHEGKKERAKKNDNIPVVKVTNNEIDPVIHDGNRV